MWLFSKLYNALFKGSVKGIGPPFAWSTNRAGKFSIIPDCPLEFMQGVFDRVRLPHDGEDRKESEGEDDGSPTDDQGMG